MSRDIDTLLPYLKSFKGVADDMEGTPILV